MAPWPRPYVWDPGQTESDRICLFFSVAEAQLCCSSTGLLLNRMTQMFKNGNNIEKRRNGDSKRQSQEQERVVVVVGVGGIEYGHREHCNVLFYFPFVV